MKEQTSTYKIPQRRGIDDLKSEYCFVGSSQGDESASNEIGDYMASKGWMMPIFKDIDITNQEEIYKESAKRKQENLDYIEKLKSNGEYGSEYELSITLIDNPLFDKPNTNSPLSSSTLVFLDTSKCKTKI